MLGFGEGVAVPGLGLYGALRVGRTASERGRAVWDSLRLESSAVTEGRRKILQTGLGLSERGKGRSGAAERSWAAVAAFSLGRESEEEGESIGPVWEWATRRGKSRPRRNRPRGWTGPATGPTGRNRRKGGKILFFFFSNLQTNFKMQIQINLKSDFKTHSTNIICSSMNAQPCC